MLLAACGGGGGGGGSTTPPVTAPIIKPTASAAPTAAASSTPNPTAFTCPTSDAPTETSVARFGGSSESATRHAVLRAGTTPASATTYLAVNYSRPVMTDANVRLIAGREQAAGATFLNSFDYPRLNITQRVIAVPTATLAQSEATLRQQSGVQSIGVTGGRRFRTTTASAPTNDPYFLGFAGTSAPYHELPLIPGEWDMYAIGLDHAFGYAQTAGNSLAANALALGSSAIKIAIIDTGEDTTHPELANKIPYQHCFITNAAGTAQSTSNYTNDEDGHGTDVAGIAAAASGNALGFTGVGGKAVIYGYRVFPTPDDSCTSPTSTDAQCSSNTTDIAAAINDAVANHVNVISMSLGGGTCDSSGNDEDATEGAAVKNAIAANIIVVAASGNNNTGSSGVTAPGCDTGVIAVGATSLDDGSATGTTGQYTTTKVAGATVSLPIEYVANYSQFGTTNTYRSASSWGIVAPGGDPAMAEESGTADDLHWIEQIWTSTPFGGNQGDTNFAGECASDYSTNGTIDCRTLIAGTSMATPHVAGAAALLLAVDPGLQSPTAMKSFLCQYADDLGDNHQGCGRLNIYRAMAHALNDPSPPS